MSYAKTILMLFVLGLLPAAGRAQVPAVAPEDFSHVVGDWFRLDASVAPTQLAVEDALILTVRISSKQPAVEPPQREKLRLFPDDVAKDFYLEDLPEKDTATERSWVLHYRLKPKRADVVSVPPLRLVYYHPARKRFQSALSEPIGHGSCSRGKSRASRATRSCALSAFAISTLMMSLTVTASWSGCQQSKSVTMATVA